MSEHEHVWDEEDEADVTYAPGDPEMTDPLVIRQCCRGLCEALQITRTVDGRTMVFVPETPGETLWGSRK